METTKNTVITCNRFKELAPRITARYPLQDGGTEYVIEDYGQAYEVLYDGQDWTCDCTDDACDHIARAQQDAEGAALSA